MHFKMTVGPFLVILLCWCHLLTGFLQLWWISHCVVHWVTGEALPALHTAKHMYNDVQKS